MEQLRNLSSLLNLDLDIIIKELPKDTTPHVLKLYDAIVNKVFCPGVEITNRLTVLNVKNTHGHQNCP